MQLNVLSKDQPDDLWYAQGLKFTCSQCGNCCTGGPGYVWISKEEIVRLAEYLNITPEETVEKYCRKLGGKFSLKEKRGPGGAYDCIFLDEVEVDATARGRELAAGDPVPLKRRACSIYRVRPLQCRTWPFWPENLSSKKRWDDAATRCHGMNHGGRTFTRERIQSIRDAKDWPDNPPTSKPSKP
jgi:Fe-S-cluster containining protein